MDSRASSPGIVRNQVLLDFKDIKRATDPPTNREKENAENARKELLEKYKTASFGELCQMTLDSRPKETLYQCLTEIYSKVRISNDRLVHSKSEIRSEVPALLCHKDTAQGI